MDSVSVKGKRFWDFALFWIAIICYNIGILFEEFTEDYTLAMPKLLIVCSVLVVFVIIVRNLNFRLEGRTNAVWALFYSTLIWCALTYFRSDSVELLDKFNYIQPYPILPYMALLLFLMPGDAMLRSFIFVGNRVNLIFIAIFLIPIVFKVNTGFIQLLLESFAISAAFIYVTNRYHPNKYVIISFIVLFLAFLVAILTARRNLMLIFALYLMVGSVLLVFNGKIKSTETRFILIVVSMLALIGAAVFYVEESKGVFSKITNRAKENTREEVFLSYIVDMSNPKDLTVGRGLFGKYYCPGVDGVNSLNPTGTEDYRKDIECGYLQLILKGGLIFLVLYLALFLVAIFKGFRASNQMCKGLACILIIQLIDMVPFGLHAFNTKTFMLWMILSVCLNNKYLQMSDDEILNLLYKKQFSLLLWQKK